MMFKYSLPLPPSDNVAYNPIGRRLVLSAEGRQYKRQVELDLIRQRAKPIPGNPRLRVVWRVHHSLRHSNWDILNRNKIFWDALQDAGLIANDNQIDDARVIRGCPVHGGPGRVDLEIEIIDPGECRP